MSAKEEHPLAVAIANLVGWAYTDSLVNLDRLKLRDCLERDAAGNSRGMLTAEECVLFVCGGEDGAIPTALSAAFPATDAYLTAEMT